MTKTRAFKDNCQILFIKNKDANVSVMQFRETHISYSQTFYNIIMATVCEGTAPNFNNSSLNWTNFVPYNSIFMALIREEK